MRAALAAFGLDAAAGPPPIDRTAAPEAIAEFVGGSHAAFNSLYEALPNDLPGDDNSVEFSTETIRGMDGNDITLRIYRSANVTGPLPCTIYIHGGGMTILDSFVKVHQKWCEDLAATGMVVIGVDFRNAYSAERNATVPRRPQRLHQRFENGSTTTETSSASPLSCCKASPEVPTWCSRPRLRPGGRIPRRNQRGLRYRSLHQRRLRLDRHPQVARTAVYDRKRRVLPQLRNDGCDCGRLRPGKRERRKPLAWPYFSTEPTSSDFHPT